MLSTMMLASGAASTSLPPVKFGSSRQLKANYDQDGADQGQTVANRRYVDDEIGVLEGRLDEMQPVVEELMIKAKMINLGLFKKISVNDVVNTAAMTGFTANCDGNDLKVTFTVADLDKPYDWSKGFMKGGGATCLGASTTKAQKALDLHDYSASLQTGNLRATLNGTELTLTIKDWGSTGSGSNGGCVKIPHVTKALSTASNGCLEYTMGLSCFGTKGNSAIGCPYMQQQ